MNQPGIKYRWVLSPLVPSSRGFTPVVAEYAIRHHAPMVLSGNVVLTHCAMLASQLAVAVLDPRLIVLESIHSNATIPAVLAANLASYGITADMTVHDLLVAMAAHHLDFAPED